MVCCCCHVLGILGFMDFRVFRYFRFLGLWPFATNGAPYAVGGHTNSPMISFAAIFV